MSVGGSQLLKVEASWDLTDPSKVANSDGLLAVAQLACGADQIVGSVVVTVKYGKRISFAIRQNGVKSDQHFKARLGTLVVLPKELHKMSEQVTPYVFARSGKAQRSLQQRTLGESETKVAKRYGRDLFLQTLVRAKQVCQSGKVAFVCAGKSSTRSRSASFFVTSGR